MKFLTQGNPLVWDPKLNIINKFVSDKNDEKHISLDHFFKDKEKFNFLKIDAEGAESEVLNGSEILLSSYIPLKVAVCCYHKPHDAIEFNTFLTQHGFSVSLSKGYMIFTEPKTFSPPYLRKGLIRAIKKIV